MKNLVISGINMIDGGALSIYYDFLNELIESDYFEKYKITIFVGKKELFEKYCNKIQIIEIPKSKKNWLYRIYYEYFYFYNYSKNKDIDIWISLHDITPNVIAKKRYVYCHNPSPFSKMKLSEIKYGLKYYLFSKFYKHLYSINIKKNTGVIVQQNWIKEEFIKMFKINNVIVAKPSINIKTQNTEKFCSDTENIFIFPSYPRYYKNFELACKAAELLIKKNIRNFKLLITIDGTENRYSREIVKKFSNCKNIQFIGLKNREVLYELYGKSKCLIFVSKLETWGLPIMEYKVFNKPMIVSKLPYAYETVSDYKFVEFVEVNDFNALAVQMEKVINNVAIVNDNINIPLSQIDASNWHELLQIIL